MREMSVSSEALMRFSTALHVRVAASYDDESFLHEAAI